MSAEDHDLTHRELVHQQIARIRRVLLDQWDPLNVGDNRKLSDEYDNYLGEIVKALDERVSVEHLARLLADIEDGWFDETYKAERWEACLAAANVLLEPPAT